MNKITITIISLLIICAFMTGIIISDKKTRICSGDIILSGEYPNPTITTQRDTCNVRIEGASIIHNYTKRDAYEVDSE